MSLSSIPGVQARIAEITSRFAVPSSPASFATALAAAQTTAPAATTPAAPAATVPAATVAPAAQRPPAASAPVAWLPSTGAGHPWGAGARVGGATSAWGAPAAGAAATTTSGRDWAARLPAEGQPWADEIERAATSAGVDPRLLAALVRAESGFKPDARSHAGAIGLAQLMPATARGLGVDPHDPVQNLEGGARFLKAMLDKFGRTDLALAAYNAGPGRVAAAGGIPNIAETQTYVRRVSAYYDELKGTA